MRVLDAGSRIVTASGGPLLLAERGVVVPSALPPFLGQQAPQGGAQKEFLRSLVAEKAQWALGQRVRLPVWLGLRPAVSKKHQIRPLRPLHCSEEFAAMSSLPRQSQRKDAKVSPFGWPQPRFPLSWMRHLSWPLCFRRAWLDPKDGFSLPNQHGLPSMQTLCLDSPTGEPHIVYKK